MKTPVKSVVTSILALAPLLAASTLSHAGDWTGEGDLGYNSASGNSTSESLAFGLGGAYEDGDWLHTTELSAYRASQDNTISARSFGLRLQTDYAIDERTFAFGNLRYLDDAFSGYDSQASISLGTGRTFIENGDTLFQGQIGAGYRRSELQDDLGTESEPVATAEITYNHGLTENTVFESNGSAESGSENTYLEAGMALRVSMTDALGIRLAYLVKHNTDVPAETENTDKYTTVSLNYKFK